MKLNRIVTCLVLSVSMLAVGSADGENCKDFVVLDTFSSRTDYSSYERVKDIVRKDESKDEASTRNLGIQAGIPIPVLDDVFALKLNGSASSQDWTKWKAGFLSSHFQEVKKDLHNSNLAHIFSD